jgi:hypothetical protein
MSVIPKHEFGQAWCENLKAKARAGTASDTQEDKINHGEPLKGREKVGIGHLWEPLWLTSTLLIRHT